jgi:hypothetical protein
MQCEEEERGGDTDSDVQDPFIAEGLSDDEDEEIPGAAVGAQPRGRNTAGKSFREALKAKLMRSLESAGNGKRRAAQMLAACVNCR